MSETHPDATTVDVADERFRTGVIAEARALYERAVHEGAGNAHVFARLALIAVNERRLDEARAAVLEALALERDNPEHHYLLGRIEKSLDKPSEAEAAYRETLRLRPENTDAWISLGILLRQQ